MNRLLKSWRIRIFLFFILLSVFLLLTKGLSYGIDFNGGTRFQIQLAQKATPSQMQDILTIISQRVDKLGLKGASVVRWGDQFIVASTAETDPVQIAHLQNILSKQGKLECILNGKVVFTGTGITSVLDDSSSFGVRPTEGGYEWSMPFVLDTNSAINFTKAAYGQCDSDGCAKTYFFIDRPTDSVLLESATLYSKEEDYLKKLHYISTSDLLSAASLEFFVVDGNLTANQKARLSKDANTHKFALISPDLKPLIPALKRYGYSVSIITPDIQKNYTSWLWPATRIRSIVSLTPTVANVGIPLEDALSKPIQTLVIQGTAPTQEIARNRLEDMKIILKSGSLPIPVAAINKESISPTLGADFLNHALLAGILSLFMVAFVIYVRYRRLKLMVPIVLTGLSEVFLILGFASLITWKLDLAAVAGIIAAVGTGVDDQIVITDELLRGEREQGHKESIIRRTKNAFFIIFAAAATTIAAMSPIVFTQLGMGKLTGFAITTIAGVLIGIFITRPAFAEVAKYILRD